MHRKLIELCDEILQCGIDSPKAVEMIKKMNFPEDMEKDELTNEILYRLNMSTLESILMDQKFKHQNEKS